MTSPVTGPAVSTVPPEVLVEQNLAALPPAAGDGFRAAHAAGADVSQVGLVIDPSTQVLFVLAPDGELLFFTPTSTGSGGLSAAWDSGGTPTGLLRVSSVEVGRWAEMFKFRRPTGRIVTVSDASHGWAYMTTRLFVLEGLEPSNASTAGRGIYIHGTNLEGSLGRPLSHGCVRIGNQAAVDLDAVVDEGAWVYVLDRPFAG